MAQINNLSRKTIQNFADADFADNTSKNISAADLRDNYNNFLNSSFGPVLIYHGRLKEGSTAVKDYYYNSLYFQEYNGPITNSSNIYSFSSTGAPGVGAGTYSKSPTGGSGAGLELSITVDGAGTITSYSILKHGTGYTIGDSLAIPSFGTNPPTISYNGVIRLSSGSTFIVTENDNLGGLNASHTETNTIVNQRINANTFSHYLHYAYMSSSTANRLLVRNDRANSSNEENSWITLWRIQERA
jgi:hypothetical protein